MGKFITNSFKLRKADESRKNVPFEYYAVFSGKEFNIPVVDVFRKGKRWFFCLLGQNLMKMR